MSSYIVNDQINTQNAFSFLPQVHKPAFKNSPLAPSVGRRKVLVLHKSLLSLSPSSGCVCSCTLHFCPPLYMQRPLSVFWHILFHMCSQCYSVEQTFFLLQYSFNTQTSWSDMVLPCVGVVKRLKMIKHHDLLTPAAEGNQGTHQRDVIFLFSIIQYSFQAPLDFELPLPLGYPIISPTIFS